MNEEVKSQAEIENDAKVNEVITKMQEEEFSLRNIGEYEVKEEKTVEVEDEIEPSEEIEEVAAEEEEKVPVKKAEPEYTTEELDAISKGWKPKSHYEGDSSQFRSAKEFLERGELLEVIRNQNKRLKRLEEDKIKEKATTILNRKREAIKNSDIESAEEYERAYYELYKSDEQKSDLIPTELDVVRDFGKRNSEWFHNYEENVAENEEMTKFAIQHDNYLSSLYPELNDNERLEKVERAVKSKYSYRFGGRPPAREKASAVNIPSSPQMKKILVSNDKITYNSLPFDVKKEVNELLPYINESFPNNPYTKESYIESLVKNGILKKENGKIVYG